MGLQTLSQYPTQPSLPPPSTANPLLSPYRIILCTAAMCGIQVSYAAQINLGTAELLRLGITPRTVSLAWLAGPLSGLLVQPIVGLVSDSCAHPLGRRRPFLIAGTLFTAFSLLLFANATQVAYLIGDSLGAMATGVGKLALGLAVVAFFLLDFSIQAIQAPLRALVTDVVPKPQRAFANAYIGVFAGLGNFIGGFLTGLPLHKWMPWFETHAQAVFGAAVVVLVVTVGMCVVSTPERAIGREEGEGEGEGMALLGGEGGRGRGVWGWCEVLRRVPRPFWQVFCVQLCTWCGFFTLFVYVNSWVGRNVYLGEGSAESGSLLRERFDMGVRLGGKGNALTALVTLGFSLMLPRMLERFGVVRVYAFSQIVEAGCLLAAPWIRGVEGEEVGYGLQMATLVDIGMFGVVWATTMGVPWTIIGDALESDPWYGRRTGLFTTLFNASQSGPQLAVAFVAPVILGVSGDDPAWVMFMGGVCAMVGALLVVWLRVDKGEEGLSLVPVGG